MTAKATGVADVKITAYKAGVTSTCAAIILYMMEKLKMGYNTRFELTISTPIVDLAETKVVADIVSFLQRKGIEFDVYNAKRMVTELKEHFVIAEKPDEQEILDYIYDVSTYSFDADEMTTEGSWYNHEKDMKKVSERFPHVTLMLDGVGEEQGDVWKKSFRGGKIVTRQKAVMTFQDEPV